MNLKVWHWACCSRKNAFITNFASKCSASRSKIHINSLLFQKFSRGLHPPDPLATIHCRCTPPFNSLDPPLPLQETCSSKELESVMLPILVSQPLPLRVTVIVQWQKHGGVWVRAHETRLPWYANYCIYLSEQTRAKPSIFSCIECG